MMRTFHSIPGLLVALFASILAISGAFLSLQPGLELATTKAPPTAQITVAQLANTVAMHQPGVERLVKTARGVIYGYGNNQSGNWKLEIDPTTGLGSPAPETEKSHTSSFMMELHRSLFLGENGRLLAGVCAGLLMLLTLSGAYLLVKRCGGLKQLFGTTKGTNSQRLHVGIGKLTVLGLLLSSLTGLYMSLANFGFVPDGGIIEADYPLVVAGTQPAPIDKLEALRSIPIANLRELTFPFAGDIEDVFAITTATGQGYVDQATGKFVSFAARGPGQRLYETIYMLHTGENGGWGTAGLALMLGVSALGMPALGITGITVWWKRKSSFQKVQNNDHPQNADTIILVGSQGNATWGFAHSLHAALKSSGQLVHICAMNNFSAEHCHAKTLLFLTSTYGNGDAPASADRFLSKLSQQVVLKHSRFAVLGFGDAQYPEFCGFAKQVNSRLVTMGCLSLMDLHTIDRQNAHSFRHWGKKLGNAMSLPLELDHTPEQPENVDLVLQSLVKNSTSDDADIAILRFSAPRMRQEAMAFEAGDLIGITPPGDTTPRYYSLASSSSEGFLEICVKRHKQGLCSNYLHELQTNDQITGFVKANPLFKPAKGNAPVIMIGAGTGMAPLAGFAKQNTTNRPMYLFWGGRNPKKDFVYRQQVLSCLGSRQLSSIKPAFSQGPRQQYVQDRLTEDAQMIRTQIQNNAQILVCGGLPMATSVRATIDQILAPLNLTVRQLQQQNRYLEDVY